MSRWSVCREERGVTLIELLCVIVLLTLVFGGIVALLSGLYTSYEQTTAVSLNHREATVIINQLVQDVKRSVADADSEPIQIDTFANRITMTTMKQTQEVQTVSYQNRHGEIIYTTDTGVEIILTADGEVTVEALDGGKKYALTVTVGHGQQQVTLSTEVARYDWGGSVNEETVEE